ncbi:MAG: DNA methyltransferase [Syntrophales bacterium]
MIFTVYFIQKKGFLDGDTEYLRNRLKLVQQARGKDKFLSFYRYFLLKLFHEGLGKAPGERKLDSELEKLLGRVPFLNGGFFEVHDLEQKYTEIDIPDEAFEKLFDFFDQYRWHLDERPLRADNEINPDVVGYIFEKYINQKQMGAYYTKEDITEYISKNTIIPFLFDAAQKKCAIAFQPDSALWRLLRDNPDRYIYPAVRHGVVSDDGSIVPESALPDFVQKGMHTPEERMHDKRYNLQQAQSGDSLRLVTETWREYVCRRNRCLEIREKLQNGEVHQINELITLNLDIWQFASDVIVNAEGPELLRAFWQAIIKITILDPTCGSGAFLFAALRILETLYSDCLACMTRFIEDLEGKPHHPEQYGDFKKVLTQIAKHPNERYFVLKSIIINNLFGVDIMKEAVEICKLRLFLKLVAQVEKVEQIEPLPDMDFNIRAGNTLVGYATADQVRKAFTEERQSDRQVQGRLLMGEEEDSFKQFEESAEMVDRAFRQFRAQQTTHGGKITHKDKLDLRNRLAELNAELDRNLASDYGITSKNSGSKAAYEQAFIQWKDSHQPFHWFVEFYGIMSAGGFDVIIGNPPYVEISDIAGQYSISGYVVKTTGNLYSYCIERFLHLQCKSAKLGVIIPISAISTPRMLPLMQLITSQPLLYVSSYAVRPGKLFNGVDMNLVICISSASGSVNSRSLIFSSNYNRWGEEARHVLFPLITYADSTFDLTTAAIPKIGSHLERSLYVKVKDNQRFDSIVADGPIETIYYHSGGRYFRKCIQKKLSNEYKELNVQKNIANPMTCLLSSSFYYWLWIALSDCYHVTKGDISCIPIPLSFLEENTFILCAKKLLSDLEKNAKVRIRSRADGTKRKEVNYYVGKSKTIIDEIDKILSKHYGFTDEELDFIINYDIKYRMGNTGDDE